MKRVLQLFVIASLVICSCKSDTSDMSEKILAFYKTYCTEGDARSRTEAILSKYCTKELKDVVMETVGEYDFVIVGRTYPDIHTESIRVAKKNEKYIVYFEYTKWPVSDEPGLDSVYVMVNEDNKISYVIRPKDNYRIPNAYYGKSIYTYDDHEYIDLGLSVNWATCNIGTTKYYPESYGDFFAWGETEGRSKFINNNYLEPKQKHYYDGKLSVLEPIDDAATKLWGKDWRLPTKEEFQELVDKCKWEWKEQNGHWGYEVTGPNGNMIFLPVGGMKMETRWLNYDEGLYYWTASCLFNDPEREPKAWMFSSVADGPDRKKNRRMQIALTPLSIQTGRSIRPVTTKQYIPIRGVDIDKTELELRVGQESVLTASFIPSDATPRNIYWKSGNSAVAHVDRNGNVTAISDGKCTITAQCGEFKKECQVTVVMPKDFVPEPKKVTTIFEFGKEVNKKFTRNRYPDYDDSDEELKEVFKSRIGDNNDDITITLYRYTGEGYDDEPGDFHIIDIRTPSGQYQFKNPYWVVEELFDNKYFYCLPMGKSRYLLFFKGWGDCCDPGDLTILAIDENGVQQVFNRVFGVKELNREPFSMTIEDNYEDGSSLYEPLYPNAYNLFIEDGALKIKNIKLPHW